MTYIIDNQMHKRKINELLKLEKQTKQNKYDNCRPTKRCVGACASAKGVSLTLMPELFN